MNTPDTLKAGIIRAAVELSILRGFMNVRRDEIAKEAGSSPATVSYHFGTMHALRSKIMSHAIATGVVQVVAQGLAIGHPVAKAAPEALKRKAARLLVA